MADKAERAMTPEEWRNGKARCVHCDDTGEICEGCSQPDGFCECEDRPRFVPCELCAPSPEVQEGP